MVISLRAYNPVANASAAPVDSMSITETDSIFSSNGFDSNPTI